MTAFYIKILRPAALTDCRFRRDFIGRLAHFYWKYILNIVSSIYCAWLTSRDLRPRESVTSLINHGLYQTTAIDFLSGASFKKLLAAEQLIKSRLIQPDIKEIVAQGNNKNQGKNYMVEVLRPDEAVETDSPILHLALDLNILMTVAGYLGTWPKLYSAAAWLNFSTLDQPKHSQLWHRDPEDLKLIKVFIYLSYVDLDSGPFQYLSQSHPFGINSGIKTRNSHPRRVGEDELDRELVDQYCISCTGQKYSLIFADTVGFHKGGNVRQGERLLLTFTYTSATPQYKRKIRVISTRKTSLESCQLKTLF